MKAKKIQNKINALFNTGARDDKFIKEMDDLYDDKRRALAKEGINKKLARVSK